MIRSPSRRSSAPRREAVRRGHSPDVKAACAARTARSASAAVPRGISAHGSPRYGLSLSKQSPEPASTHSPPTYIRYRARVEVVVMWCRRNIMPICSLPRRRIQRRSGLTPAACFLIIQRNYSPSALPKGTDVAELTSRIIGPLTLLIERSGIDQDNALGTARPSRLDSVQDQLSRSGRRPARGRSATSSCCRCAEIAIDLRQAATPRVRPSISPTPSTRCRASRRRPDRRRSSWTPSSRGATASSGPSTACSGSSSATGRRTPSAASRRRCRAAAPTPTIRRRSRLGRRILGRCSATCETRGQLPHDIYAMEIGVGSGARARLWLDQFQALDDRERHRLLPAAAVPPRRLLADDARHGARRGRSARAALQRHPDRRDEPVQGAVVPPVQDPVRPPDERLRQPDRSTRSPAATASCTSSRCGRTSAPPRREQHHGGVRLRPERAARRDQAAARLRPRSGRRPRARAWRSGRASGTPSGSRSGCARSTRATTRTCRRA